MNHSSLSSAIWCLTILLVFGLVCYLAMRLSAYLLEHMTEISQESIDSKDSERYLKCSGHE